MHDADVNSCNTISPTSDHTCQAAGMTVHNANATCRAVGVTTTVNATDCHNDGALMQAKAHGGAAVNIVQDITHYDYENSHTTTNMPPNEGSPEIPVLIKDTQ